MTKTQQETGRELHVSMGKWLISYGWQPLNNTHTMWMHKKIGNLAHTTHDAYMATRAQPSLGW